MRTLLLPLRARFAAYTLVLAVTLTLVVLFIFGSPPLYLAIPLAAFAVLAAIGTSDLTQKRHAILRNYPLLAHIRFILEEIRPEIRQYFWKARKMARRSRATNARLFISAPSKPWTNARLERRTTSTPAAMSGCITPWRRSFRAAILFALPSAAPIARSPISPRSSTFLP
jgi:hypothetical protein